MKLRCKSNGTLYYDDEDKKKLFNHFYQKYKNYTLKNTKQKKILINYT